jgi:hypothetical protein
VVLRIDARNRPGGPIFRFEGPGGEQAPFELARGVARDATVPMTLVVDHSLQADVAASPDAEAINLRREFERNGERYRLLKWAEQAFDGLTVFPPNAGIIHQIHLEQIAAVTLVDRSRAPPVAFPDFTIAGDSHTPMVNALGVLGWGVGGIEIEAAVVLGQLYIFPKPEFIGVRLDGALADGITMTDMALTLTERLRAAEVAPRRRNRSIRHCATNRCYIVGRHHRARCPDREVRQPVRHRLDVRADSHVDAARRDIDGVDATHRSFNRAMERPAR